MEQPKMPKNLLEPYKVKRVEQLNPGDIIRFTKTDEKIPIKDIIFGFEENAHREPNFLFFGMAIKKRLISKMFETSAEGHIKVYSTTN